MVIVLAGCAARPAPEASPVAGADDGNQSTPSDVQSIIDAATHDAASRLNIDPDAVEIVNTKRVTWSDGSLGCPAPGMQYTQALVPGYRVILRAGRQQFDYHAAANGHLVLCPPERAMEPIPDERI
jgi:hypothetical protein